MIKTTTISAIVVAAILFASSSGLATQKASAHEGFEYFLKIDGITGEGPDGSIPVAVYSWGGSQDNGCSTSSAQTCKINWGDLTLHLETTLATPQLFLPAVQGTALKGVTLYIVQDNSLKNPLETITIVDPMITSFNIMDMTHSPAGGPIPCCGLTLHFAKITFTSFGAGGQSYTSTWNFATNSAS